MQDFSRVGGHVSTAGGLFRGIEKAESIGAEVMQIFGSSPRSWNRRAITDEEIEKFNTLREEKLIAKVYIHACYLINFGSNLRESLKRSKNSLLADLELADKINAYGVVVHPGSLKDGTNISDISENIKLVLENFEGNAKILIENSAGGGSSVPRTIDEIAEMVRLVNDNRVEVCIDTAHLWGFGIDISTEEKVDKLAEELENKLSGVNVPIVHFNDSKARLGSLLDRHENIGNGQIGIEGLREIASHNYFKNSDLVLEVPGLFKNGPDSENIHILKDLII